MLEIAALQADLRVVRKANTLLITTPDHATLVEKDAIESQRNAIEARS